MSFTPLSLHTARSDKSRPCPHRRTAMPRHPYVKPPHRRVKNMTIPKNMTITEFHKANFSDGDGRGVARVEAGRDFDDDGGRRRAVQACQAVARHGAHATHAERMRATPARSPPPPPRRRPFTTPFATRFYSFLCGGPSSGRKFAPSTVCLHGTGGCASCRDGE